MRFPYYLRVMLCGVCMVLGSIGGFGQTAEEPIQSYPSSSGSTEILVAGSTSPESESGVQPLNLPKPGGMTGLSPTAQSQLCSTWQFELQPYAWLVGTRGFIERNGSVGSDYDLETSDVVNSLDELEAMLPVYLEARKGRVSFFADVFYGKWEHLTTGDLGFQSPVPGVDLDMTWEELLLQYGMGYTLCEFNTPAGRKVRLDLQGGGRYLYISGDSAIGDPNSGVEIGLDGSENFSEPWVGCRLDFGLCNRTNLRLGGDIGGFDLGDSVGTNWQAYALLQYQVTSNVSLDAGYRHLKLKYEDGFKGGLLAFEQEAYGPVIGLTYKF